MNIPRIERVRKLMRESGLEQLIITQPQAIYYLTGKWVSPMDRLDALVLTQYDVRIVCYNLAVIDVPNCKTIVYDDMSRALPSLKEVMLNVPTGIEGDMSARFCIPLIKDMRDIKFASSNCVDVARMVKDEDEINRLKYASALTDDVFRESFARIEAGMTERDLAKVFCERFEAHGAGVFPGVPMAAFGSGTADPHASTGDRRLKSGDAIMVDTGMRINGYYSDTTRTAFCGEISDEQKRIYDIVLRANEAAIAAVHPGALLNDVDSAAREVISKAGFGQYFTHKTSHGVGIDFHEMPSVRADQQIVLEPGMAFSIEPGIYLPDKFGVRIEDLAIVDAHGVNVVTHCDKSLMVIL